MDRINTTIHKNHKDGSYTFIAQAQGSPARVVDSDSGLTLQEALEAASQVPKGMSVMTVTLAIMPDPVIEEPEPQA